MTTATSPNETYGWFSAKQQIEVRTRVVLDNEWCYLLSETNRRSRSGKSVLRYQTLSVVRGDRLVTAVRSLGPAKAFTQDQFQIPGGEVDEWGRGKVWHTVAELREIADDLRSEQPRREVEPTDLWGAWRDLNEEKRRRAKRQSTIGAAVRIQR